jgi:hypothetical protein
VSGRRRRPIRVLAMFVSAVVVVVFFLAQSNGVDLPPWAWAGGLLVMGGVIGSLLWEAKRDSSNPTQRDSPSGS